MLTKSCYVIHQHHHLEQFVKCLPDLADLLTFPQILLKDLNPVLIVKCDIALPYQEYTHKYKDLQKMNGVLAEMVCIKAL